MRNSNNKGCGVPADNAQDNCTLGTGPASDTAFIVAYLTGLRRGCAKARARIVGRGGGQCLCDGGVRHSGSFIVVRLCKNRAITHAWVCVCAPCVCRVCALFELVHTAKPVCVLPSQSEHCMCECVCVQNRGLSAVYETMPKITHTPHSTQPPLRWPCLITGNERGRGMDRKGKGKWGRGLAATV